MAGTDLKVDIVMMEGGDNEWEKKDEDVVPKISHITSGISSPKSSIRRCDTADRDDAEKKEDRREAEIEVQEEKQDEESSVDYVEKFQQQEEKNMQLDSSAEYVGEFSEQEKENKEEISVQLDHEMEMENNYDFVAAYDESMIYKLPAFNREHVMNGVVHSPIRGKDGFSPLQDKFACSSPRVFRAVTKDGNMKEFKVHTPVVRNTQVLKLRRVNSDLNDSHTQLFIGRKRMIADSSIETDDDYDARVAGLKSDPEDEVLGPSSSKRACLFPMDANLDDSITAPLHEPFKNILLRQPSELLEDRINLTPNRIVHDEERKAKDRQKLMKCAENLGLTPKQGGKEDEPQEEFTIKRRSVSRLQKENIQTQNPDVLPRSRSDPQPSSSGFNCRSLLLKTCKIKEEHVKSAVERLTDQHGQIISDGTRTYSLPCFQSQKQDLMCISCDTMRDVLAGRFAHTIEQYFILDCRYEYEYVGGHIMGADNLHHTDNIEKIMSWKVDDSKHIVLIFHCEFSSQRAPSMMRNLRNKDREQNLHKYPSLCYPEMYLLEGGYSAFWKKYRNWCEPQGYIKMTDKDHAEELRHLKRRSTTWAAGQKPGTNTIIL